MPLRANHFLCGGGKIPKPSSYILVSEVIPKYIKFTVFLQFERLIRLYDGTPCRDYVRQVSVLPLVMLTCTGFNPSPVWIQRS